MRIILKFYKHTVSSAVNLLFGDGCIYHPTCSEYCTSAYESYGFFKATFLSIKRIASCNGFSKKDYYYPLK